jgi:hypothetical protein
MQLLTDIVVFADTKQSNKSFEINIRKRIDSIHIFHHRQRMVSGFENCEDSVKTKTNLFFGCRGLTIT